MNTPSAMITTTCSGTPSCWNGSSTNVPTSLPGTVTSSSARLLLRISGGGAAAASSDLKRSISACASMYLAKISSFGGLGERDRECSIGGEDSTGGCTKTETGGTAWSSSNAGSSCDSSRATVKSAGGVCERGSSWEVDCENSGIGAVWPLVSGSWRTVSKCCDDVSGGGKVL